MIKVGVVVLNYKLKDQTISCIKSVKNSDYKDLLIIVVDNNSQDGLGDELSREKQLIFVQNNQNLGYTGGNNVGIKKALELGVDLCFILNPDTKVKQGTIANLVNVITDDIGIVAPKLLFMDSNKIWYAGGILDLDNVLGSHRGVDQIDKGQFEEKEETDFATGAAMMVKREVFEKVGLFDERYFLYYEDSDFCLRAKKMGFKILYNPKAVMYHKNAQSTGLGSPIQDYYITRNRMLLAHKFLPIRTRFALFREALRNLHNPVRRKAWLDFLLGRFGKGWG